MVDDKAQQASARPGGQAKGGIAPQPGDPTSPRKAAARAAARDDDMQRHGFSDHKGADQGGGDLPPSIVPERP